MHWALIAATTFGLVLPAELPDKTMFATLVLATRFRALPVWVGVAAAFAVQSAVAVLAGGLLLLLPRVAVLAVAAALFALGAVLLLRAGDPLVEAAAEESQVRADVDRRPVAAATFQRTALTSFTVLFAAEWGDLSQLLTASLVARYGTPAAVFLGAWSALVLIAGVAVLAGRTVVRVVPLRLARLVASALFAALAVATAVEAATRA